MKKIASFLLLALLCWQCKINRETMTPKPFITDRTVEIAVDSLVAKYGVAEESRVLKGVKQAASFWQTSDGTPEEFMAFCNENFIGDTAMLYKVFDRISTNFETIFGYFNKISVDLQRPLQLDMGDILPVDERFGAYNPMTHFTDDFFSNKLAFVIMLNFPYYTLEEKTRNAGLWSRREWAYARLGDVFDSRVPADVSQQVVNALTKADVYIADYNIYAGKLVNDSGKTLFPSDMKLLSHWNIRDEIKANYGKEDGLEKQQMLYQVMKRIITQEIPTEVINSDKYSWSPYTNKVFENKTEIKSSPEDTTRYAVLLGNFHAEQKIDKYYPALNTYIRRNFESDMEIPLDDAEKLFNEYLTSPEVQKVADIIKDRLGRKLEPFDIWYDGFKTRTTIPSELLDKTTRAKYPNREAVQADLPNILMKLGFSREQAMFITSKIQVDPARGSGHASPSETKAEKSLLRTRIFANGMDYKGYNIAVHEFGHNVEQTISLHDVDYYMMHGVPNTAFTEALAFVFQKRDLDLLGLKDNNPQKVYFDYLDNFWSLYEIMGVSMVDIGTWQWLYANPSATPSELKDAVIRIAVEVWNKYYAPVFGVKDQPILAVYSHMISYPLYLPNYAYGQIIEFQIEQYLKGKDFAKEIERIYSQGRLIPQEWMKEAVGSKISVKPLLDATDEALVKLK